MINLVQENPLIYSYITVCKEKYFSDAYRVVWNKEVTAYEGASSQSRWRWSGKSDVGGVCEVGLIKTDVLVVDAENLQIKGIFLNSFLTTSITIQAQILISFVGRNIDLSLKHIPLLTF